MSNQCSQCGDFIQSDQFGTCDDCGEGLKAETHTEQSGESLEDFGVDSDPVERETVRDHGIDQFGADTRETQDSDDSEQSQLFADVDESQQTLGGDSAAEQSLFGDK